MHTKIKSPSPPESRKVRPRLCRTAETVQFLVQKFNTSDQSEGWHGPGGRLPYLLSPFVIGQSGRSLGLVWPSEGVAVFPLRRVLARCQGVPFLVTPIIINSNCPFYVASPICNGLAWLLSPALHNFM